MENSASLNAAEAEKWPVSEGRYEVGDSKSPVAICTMASVDLKFPMDKIAIAGKCVTENIGVEKIVKNIVSNPHIRFLIMCGKVSKGHFVEQAIESLIENGVDNDMNIIGAKGAMPSVKNLTMEEVERFRKQVIPINIAGNEDPDKIMEVVSACCSKNPGAFEFMPEKGVQGIVDMENEKRVVAEEAKSAESEGPKESSPFSINADSSLLPWRQDEKGFFIINPDAHRQEIIVEYHDNEGRMLGTIIGRDAEEISKTIVSKDLVSEQSHCAYLGRELIKAEIAMKHKLEYVQDKELSIPTKVEKRSEIRIHGEAMEKKTYLTKNEKNSPVYVEKAEKDESFRQLLRDIGMGRAF